MNMRRCFVQMQRPVKDMHILSETALKFLKEIHCYLSECFSGNRLLISAPAITSHFQSLQTLFMMEDHLGAHPVRVNGNYYISFYEDDENPHLGNISTEGIQLWCERLEEYRKILAETPGQAEDAKKEYDLWRYRYPMDNAEKTSKQIRRMMRMDQLREELARLEEEEKEDRKS